MDQTRNSFFGTGWGGDDYGAITVGRFNIEKQKDKGWKITNLKEVFTAAKMTNQEILAMERQFSKFGNTEAGLNNLISFLTKYNAHIEHYKKTNGINSTPAEVSPGLDPTAKLNPGGLKL